MVNKSNWMWTSVALWFMANSFEFSLRVSQHISIIRIICKKFAFWALGKFCRGREGGREQTDIFEIHIAWIKLQCKTKCFRVVRMFNASLTAPAKCINIFFVDVRRILENANKTITRAISETKNGVAALIYLSEHCIGRVTEKCCILCGCCKI